MKVVLIGQKKFGLHVLQLIEACGHEVVGIAAPDSDTVLLPYARETGYYIVTPSTVKKYCKDFDLGITVFSTARIDTETIGMAKLGWVGYHPSLLPRHRGPAAIEWAKRMNDPIIGGTVYWLNDKWDEGDIAYQDWLWLDHDKTIKELWDEELQPLGLRLIKRMLQDINNGRAIPRTPQSNFQKFATYEPAV